MLAMHLEQKALLKATRANTRWIEILQDQQHLLHLFFLHVQTLVDRQLVGNAVEGDTEQAVIIQTADQIFQYLLLPTRQFALTHLLHEFVHKRDRVAIDHTLIVGRIGGLRTGIIDGQVIVLASYSLQGRVEGVLSFLPLLLLFEGFSIIPTCPIAIPSQTAIAGNTTGTPPAIATPNLTASTILSRFI